MYPKLPHLVITTCLAVICCGCERAPQPFSDASIDQMAESRFAIARIIYENDRHMLVMPENYNKLRSLFRLLKPTKYTGSGTVGDCKYALIFVNPDESVRIDIRVANNELEFSSDGFLYAGGKPKEFKALFDGLWQLGTEDE